MPTSSIPKIQRFKKYVLIFGLFTNKKKYLCLLQNSQSLPQSDDQVSKQIEEKNLKIFLEKLKTPDWKY